MDALLKKGLARGRLYIEAVTPEIDGGRYATKAIVHDTVAVGADIVRDGHDEVRAVVRYELDGSGNPQETEMTYDHDSDRWSATIVPDAIGLWTYTIVAWTDTFGTWRRDLTKRYGAGQDLNVEFEVGALLVSRAARHGGKKAETFLKKVAKAFRTRHEGADDPRMDIATGSELHALMAELAPRDDESRYGHALKRRVDPPLARFGAWYEFFPRSTGPAGKHGTFRTAKKKLPSIAKMGFDVVYLPPIHPIGTTHRKGKNNTLDPAPGDVGSPWAIGNREGGHA
ncbi:MAG: DUF3416 domain-containing protein, partial [Myxococcales bacterium]|nr:DUF3416 domain-containing protein [Myxococcales bacterium]